MDDLFIAAFGLDKRKNKVNDSSKNFFEKVDNDDTIFLKEIVNGSIREIEIEATRLQKFLVINNKREDDDLQFSVQVLEMEEDGIRVRIGGNIYGLGETRVLPEVLLANKIKIPFETFIWLEDIIFIASKLPIDVKKIYQAVGADENGNTPENYWQLQREFFEKLVVDYLERYHFGYEQDFCRLLSPYWAVKGEWSLVRQWEDIPSKEQIKKLDRVKSFLDGMFITEKITRDDKERWILNKNTPENKPKDLIQCFKDTLKYCESDELRDETEKSVFSSQIYPEGFFAKRRIKNKKADILVERTTTFGAASRYRDLGKIAVLNFANPEIPGGGVKNGAKAQEESLCRCSNLYPCIASPRVQEEFYKYHYLKKRFFYSDRVIYTKDVTVFKDDELDMLDKEKWFHVDVLTCAAPFTAKIGYVKEAFSGSEKFKLSRTALMRIFESRIKNIISVAMDNEADILILGAFGCGAFKNPPDIVARAFKNVIQKNHYEECFDKIIFAVKSSNYDNPYEICPNLLAFETEFYGKSKEFEKNGYAYKKYFYHGYKEGTLCGPLYSDAADRSESIFLLGKWFEENIQSGVLYSGRGKTTRRSYLRWQKTNKYSGKQFSVLGDSISTLAGYNPEGYNVFFSEDVREKSNVWGKDFTWWGQVIDYVGGELLVSNAWSGSCVTKMPDRDSLFPSACSDERTNGLHLECVKPDVIMIYLGINDWAKGLGMPGKGYRGRKSEEKTIPFETAYQIMIQKLKMNYPDAEIWCCTLCPTFMSIDTSFVFPAMFGGVHIEEYNQVIRETARREGCKLLDLYLYQTPYDTIDGTHPNSSGMKTLATLVLREALEESESEFLDCEDQHEFITINNKICICKKCKKKIRRDPKLEWEYVRRSANQTAELPFDREGKNETTLLYPDKVGKNKTTRLYPEMREKNRIVQTRPNLLKKIGNFVNRRSSSKKDDI